MAKAKKVVKKRAVKKTVKPELKRLSWRDRLSIKLLVMKAHLNLLWLSLKAKLRGY